MHACKEYGQTRTLAKNMHKKQAGGFVREQIYDNSLFLRKENQYL